MLAMFTHPRVFRCGIAALVLGGSSLLAACTPFATYPPMPGTSTVEPWVYPVPQSMQTAISYTRRRLAPPSASTFNLPPGVPEWVWTDIGTAVGLSPMTDDGMLAISVEEVRVNGGRAEVDVLYPTEDGFFQRVTIGLRIDPLQQPRIEFERRWRLPVPAPVSNWSRRQQPNYSGWSDDAGRSGQAEGSPPPAAEG